MAVTRIAGVSLTVPDLDAAARFYVEALGFVVEQDMLADASAYTRALGLQGTSVTGRRLRLGAQSLQLLAFDPPGRPYPAESTASDLWFQHCAIVVGDMAEAHAHLGRFGPVAITQGGPQRLPPHTGSVTAWKFRDPFGHPLELLHFPEGVGHADWHRSDPPLFMGIDHTAIAVNDTAAAIAFYEPRFGFRVSSRSHNQGPEQSRLDGIPDADVDVIGLSLTDGPPHLELLGYRTGTRRPRPGDGTEADASISRTIIEISGADLVLAADPDRHEILIRGSG